MARHEIAFDDDTATLARAAAREAGVSLSEYVRGATRDRLRTDGAAGMRAFMATTEGRELGREIADQAGRAAPAWDRLDDSSSAA